MGFPGEISAPNLVNMRGDYHGRTFLLATPEDIVFQAELPSLSGTYAVITYGSVLAGVYSDVIPDMVYTITETDSDFNKPVIRGYIRKGAATATDIYIDVQDDTLSSGYIITVFMDFDIFPRKPRRSLDINYTDYDLPLELQPPMITGLQSVYVEDTTAASASIVFAPTVTYIGANNSIVSYLWEVDDGTITVGTSTDKDVTVSFPVGHRWVHFSSTDAIGVSHTLHFEVYVGDLISAAFTLHGAETIQWSGEFDGYNGSATMFDDVDGVVDNQRFTVCVLDTPGPVNTNLALIGRYRREATKTDGGDSTGRNLQDSELTIEGFGTSLSNIPVPKFNVTDVDSPIAWNDITNPNPVLVAWHVLTRYTTAATIQSFDSLATDLVYQSGAIAVSSQGCLSAINQVLERNNAACNFSADGTLRIRRDTNFIDVRSGLAVIADIQTQDMGNYQITTEYNDAVGQVIGGGLHYDPTLKQYEFFVAKAPTVVSTIGEEVQQINGQILDSTDTQDEAGEDLQDRTASKLAQGRVITTLSIDLFDSWRFIEPSNYDRYTATIPASLNMRSKSYGSSDYWQLRSISCTANVKEGTVQPRAVLIAETVAGTAGRVSTIIPPASDVQIPVYPVMQPYGGEFNVNGALFNPEDFDSSDWGISPESLQVNEPKDANAIKPMPSGNIGIYTVYYGDSVGRTTLFDSTLGEEYTVQVTLQGWDTLEDISIDLLDGNGQGALVPGGEQLDGHSFAPGMYDETNDYFWQWDKRLSIGQGICTDIIYTLPDNSVLTWFQMTCNAGRSNDPTHGERVAAVALDNVILAEATHGAGTYAFGSLGGNVFPTWSGAEIGRVLQIHDSIDRNNGSATTDSRSSIRRVRFNYTSPKPVDAFYKDYTEGTATEHAVSNGLLVDGLNPSSIPVYDENHKYTIKVTGTGSPFVFNYGDTTSYADNLGNMEIKIEGPGAY